MTCAEAKQYTLDNLQSGQTGTDSVAITGYVTYTNGTLSRGQQTFWLDDTKGNTQTFQAYWCNIPTGEEALNVGDKVTIRGFLMNYSGTAAIAQGAIATFVPEPLVLEEVNCNVRYLDKNAAELSSEVLTFHVPEAPAIDGFTFLRWEFVAGDMADGLTIRAVYKPDDDATDLPSEIQVPGNKAMKLVRDGNVYILKGDQVFTIHGQRVH